MQLVFKTKLDNLSGFKQVIRLEALLNKIFLKLLPALLEMLQKLRASS